jgi:hypothetical protein
MRDFLLQNGDLVIGQAGYQEVTGQAKIVQDLTSATVTPYGSNRFHQGYGSVLATKVGQPETGLTQGQVNAEVQRIVNNYIMTQQMILQSYQNRGFASPYNNDDLVAAVPGIDVVVSTDTITVNAQIKTAANQTVSLNTAVSA